MNGAQLITLEREGHEARGYDAAHDDHEDDGELAVAAAMYAADTTDLDTYIPDNLWPWTGQDDYPDKRGELDRIRQLTIAGGLVAAEIDRLLRKEKILALEEQWGDDFWLNRIEAYGIKFKNGRQHLLGVKMLITYRDTVANPWEGFAAYISMKDVKGPQINQEFIIEGPKLEAYALNGWLTDDYWPKVQDAAARYEAYFNKLSNLESEVSNA